LQSRCLVKMHSPRTVLTDPVKIARECKSDFELLCKGLRPGGQRIISCLKEKLPELSPACSAAFKSIE
jgi:hypothetical protein